MEFEAGNLGLLCIFFSSLAVIADKMEIVLLSLRLRDV